jgi:hypothetical protein
MNAESGVRQRPTSPLGLLAASWWFVWPASTVLIVRLLVDRACGDPYNLLPALTADPRWAWPLAFVYVLGHAWFLSGYLATVEAAGTLAPGVAAIRSVWGRHAIKLLLMAAVLLLEYSPVGLWRAVGAGIGCP